MKSFSFLVFAALLATAFQLSAQTEKGSLLIGGTAGFSTSKIDETNLTAIYLNPLAGYFVIDQLAVGANVTVLATKFDDLNSTQFGVGPFARYYFNGSGAGRFFGQAGFNWSSSKTGDLEAVSTTGFDAGVGLDYFLNDHVAIETFIGYDFSKDEGASEGVGTFGLQIGIAAFISGKQSKN